MNEQALACRERVAGSVLSRDLVLKLLLIVPCANGLAARIIAKIHDNGFLSALASSFDVSAIVWLACLAGCLLLAEKVPGGARNLDLAAVALVFSLCLVPILTLNWAALTIAAFYVAAVTRDGSPLYRASLIALAITGPMAWGPELLNAVFEPFQVIDAQLVSLLVGAGQVGRSVEVVDGSARIFIAPGCSSFHNISLALLGWVTATNFFASQDRARNQLFWGLIACSGVLLINVTRIALIGLYPRYYDAIHGQPGEVIANLLSLGWIGAICLLGVRDELRRAV